MCKMTEDQAERVAERRMDRLDAKLIRGAITMGEYDAEVHAIELEVRSNTKRTSRH